MHLPGNEIAGQVSIHPTGRESKFYILPFNYLYLMIFRINVVDLFDKNTQKSAKMDSCQTAFCSSLLICNKYYL